MNPRNPLNIGAAARAMSNFGVDRLRVVAPYDIAFRQARSAVGAASLLANAEQFETVAEAVADCQLVVGTTAVRHRELQHPLRDLDVETGRLIRDHLASQTVGLLFGSEKFGLSNKDLSYCHWLVRIRTPGEHPSMNLGQAVAVCLYELTRADDRPGEPNPLSPVEDAPHATAEDEERIVRALMDALNVSEYVKRHTEDSVRENARRFVRRLHLQRPDAELFLGMLRQILWKLRDVGHRKERNKET